MTYAGNNPQAAGFADIIAEKEKTFVPGNFCNRIRYSLWKE